MRATTHNGRANKNGAYRASHNDRKFDLDKAEHIDQDKTKKNLYWHYLQTEPGIDFTEAERRFYESHFSAGLQAKNASYQKHGNITMSSSSRPSDFRNSSTKGDTVVSWHPVIE